MHGGEEKTDVIEAIGMVIEVNFLSIEAIGTVIEVNFMPIEAINEVPEIINNALTIYFKRT